MTDERKNEIWAFLTQEERRWLTELYKNNNGNSNYCNGCNDALMLIFGPHNLTAQADETTLKSPSHGENVPKTSVPEPETVQKSPSGVDYSQYRLDLAKEIAVAMIKSGEKPGLCSRAERAVEMASEIVKRFKETEI